MHHPGDVVTKGQILDAVWDPAFDGEPNIVEVYIRYLRRKIDLPFGRRAIETARGQGYRLAPGRRLTAGTAGSRTSTRHPSAAASR